MPAGSVFTFELKQRILKAAETNESWTTPHAVWDVYIYIYSILRIVHGLGNFVKSIFLANGAATWTRESNTKQRKMNLTADRTAVRGSLSRNETLLLFGLPLSSRVTHLRFTIKRQEHIILIALLNLPFGWHSNWQIALPFKWKEAWFRKIERDLDFETDVANVSVTTWQI